MKLCAFTIYLSLGTDSLFWNGLQITDLPFSLYSTFVIEARHGFNKVCILFVAPYRFCLLLFPGL